MASCSHIVVLAARDAVSLSNGPHFVVLIGRRNGRISKAEDAANLPDTEDSIETLKAKFIKHGFIEKDLVLLSVGAHTIRRAACFLVTRLLDAKDPAISPEFFQILRSRCPPHGDVGVKLPSAFAEDFAGAMVKMDLAN